MSTNLRYCCAICHVPFSESSTLQSHVMATHPYCGLCKSQFDSLDLLQDHQKAQNHLYCKICGIGFFGKPARKSHNKTMHPPCDVCRKRFDLLEHLQSHQKETGHLYCSACDLIFSKKCDSRSHSKAMHPPCGLCRERFDSLENLQSHQKVTGHLYCSECDLFFTTNKIHIRHARAVEHTAQYHCCDCDREYNSQRSLDTHCCDCDKVFPSRTSLNRHFKKDRTHRPRVKDVQVQNNENVPHKCCKSAEECPSKKASKKHRSKHSSLRRIPCPLSEACKRKFITPSGLIDHLESGGCHSGMTRAKMHELIFAHDQSHHITDIGAGGLTNSIEQESLRYCSNSFVSLTTNGISQFPRTAPPAILTSPRQFGQVGDELNASIDDDTFSDWSVLDEVPVRIAPSDSGSRWSILSEVPLQPAISASGSEWSLVSPIHTPAGSHSSDIDLDRISDIITLHNLRCPRCPPSRGPFCNTGALAAHVSSATHAPKVFHCPLAFMPHASPAIKPKKEKHFATLAGLAQHLECGACRGGVATFVNVMEFVQEQLRSLGFETARLLLD